MEQSQRRADRGRWGVIAAACWLIGSAPAAMALPPVPTTELPSTPAPVPAAASFPGPMSSGIPSPTLPQPAPADILPAPIQRPTHLVLHLSQRQVQVYSGPTLLVTYPVAVGAPATPTPVGEFQVFQMVEQPRWQNPWTGEVHPPGANSALGLRWIGFTRLEGGIIGFHGTPTVDSIGQAASNGCVRLRNEHVLALYEQVHLGMRVVVEP